MHPSSISHRAATAWAAVHSRAQAMARCEDGNIALTFGIVFMVLLGSAGSAIDLARTFSVQQALQNDLDAAVLSAASIRMTDSSTDVSLLAQRHMDLNWKRKHETGAVSISAAAGASDRVTGSASVTVPTTFMGLFGYESLPVSVTTEAVYTTQDVEAALVLDTTGSMAGSKLSALQSASQGLLDALYATERSRLSVKTAIVPFSQYVNVGLANRGASWLSVAPDSSVQREHCRYERPVVGSSNCRTETYTYYNDGVPTSYQGQVCDYQYGPEQYMCTPYTENLVWNGCVGSRTYPLNIQDEDYSANPVPGIRNASCPSPITPLTNETSTLRDRIRDMVATGNTYIPGGLAWGWRALSSTEPYAEARGYEHKVNGLKVRKIMVLMTDGENTISPTYPEHNGSDSTLANSLTAELCTNIKAAGIEIFTVAFDVRTSTINDILRTCASRSANYFAASDAAELSSAFLSIARAMSPLRIAR